MRMIWRRYGTDPQEGCNGEASECTVCILQVRPEWNSLVILEWNHPVRLEWTRFGIGLSSIRL
jgi:hypothetical protein